MSIEERETSNSIRVWYSFHLTQNSPIDKVAMSTADEQPLEQPNPGNSQGNPASLDKAASILLPLRGVTRRVVASQWLWTAGYTLTSGGFLLYFAKALGANGITITLLLALPEFVGVFALASRPILRFVGSRKRTFFIGTLISRACMLAVPVCGFTGFRGSAGPAFGTMVSFLAVTYAIEAVAYVSYVSWLSDLAPRENWGRFFAWRNIGKLAALLPVPVVAAYLREQWKKSGAVEDALVAYEVVFMLGLALQLISLWPLLKLPDLPMLRTESLPKLSLQMFRDAWRNRSMRFLLIHNWWLAFANGLSQQVFFYVVYQQLSLELAVYYSLTCLMRVVKLPVSWLTGLISDRVGDRALLIFGVVVASSGLVFWLFAENWGWKWLIPAYFYWGFFAAANIAGRNLALALSPEGDNTVHVGLFRQLGGFLAGVSGILGGLWLMSLLEARFQWTFAGCQIEAPHLIILISLLGRWTSVLWLLPVREPAGRTDALTT